MAEVENADYIKFAIRTIRAAGRRCAEGDVEMLPAIRALHDAVNSAEAAALTGLLQNGYSGAECAKRLGCTRQALHAKHRQVFLDLAEVNAHTDGTATEPLEATI